MHANADPSRARRAALLALLIPILVGCASGPKVSAPSVAFTPPAGTFDGSTTVELKTAATGQDILYTLDKSEPGTAEGGSTKKYDPAKKIVLKAEGDVAETGISWTIKARSVPAAQQKGANSPIVSAVYTITGAIRQPTIKILDVSSTLSGIAVCALAPSGLTTVRIRYTLDGSSPGREYGAEYEGIPVRIEKGMTLKAMAWRKDSRDSFVKTISWQDAMVEVAQRESADRSREAEIRGSTTSTTAVGSQGTDSASASKTGAGATSGSSGADPGATGSTPTGTAVASPGFDPAPGSFPAPILVALSLPGSLPAGASGSKLRFTTDGSDPGLANGTEYSSPIRIDSKTTIRAVAIVEVPGKGPLVSKPVSGVFEITGTVATPLIQPASGRYVATRKITLSTTTPGATIRYTLDGTDPTGNKGLSYTAPFSAAGQISIMAIAQMPGWKDSPPAKADLTLVELPQMIPVAGGIFSMGFANGEEDEKPVRTVSLAPFAISKHEITQAQYRQVMGANPSYFKEGTDADRRPVEQVSWYNAVGYCNALSDLAGLARVYTIQGSTVSADFSKAGYRLPTEAEWEYAARGGSAGTQAGAAQTRYAGSDTADTVSWNARNAGGTTRPVGTREPNSLGLFDMTGNVWEWCEDWYGIYTAAGGKTIPDPRGPATGTKRVKRGGSWNRLPDFSRVSFRNYHTPQNSDRTLGFRVAMSAIK